MFTTPLHSLLVAIILYTVEEHSQHVFPVISAIGFFFHDSPLPQTHVYTERVSKLIITGFLYLVSIITF